MIRKGILSLLLVFGFLLGISDGYIALWKDEDPVPQVFPYRADRLPEQDRKRLERGIRIEEGSELERMIEDYLS